MRDNCIQTLIKMIKKKKCMYLVLCGWNLVATKMMKLSNFNIWGQSGRGSQTVRSSRWLCQGLRSGGADGSLSAGIRFHRHWERVGSRELTW